MSDYCSETTICHLIFEHCLVDLMPKLLCTSQACPAVAAPPATHICINRLSMQSNDLYVHERLYMHTQARHDEYNITCQTPMLSISMSSLCELVQLSLLARLPGRHASHCSRSSVHLSASQRESWRRRSLLALRLPAGSHRRLASGPTLLCHLGGFRKAVAVRRPPRAFQTQASLDCLSNALRTC